jgi:hypothetical protein
MPTKELSLLGELSLTNKLAVMVNEVIAITCLKPENAGRKFPDLKFRPLY